jgi:hypothetical protein
VVFDKAGNIYGVTVTGGGNGCFDNQGCGMVYELTPTSGGGWQETTLYSFANGSNGNQPAAGLVEDAAGNFYGGTLSLCPDNWEKLPLHSLPLPGIRMLG